ncbi:MAG: TetR/AcrR family transcriptional regulator [Flammeovirgaceae bacterium]
MKTTKDKLLDLGEWLIQQHGYAGFSYYQMAETLGIKHAAIHYHFKKKEDLGKAIIQRIITRAQREFDQWDQLDDWAKLQAFLTIYRRVDDCKRICFVGALSGGFVDLPPSLQTDLQELIEHLWNWLAQALELGRSNGSFAFQGAARTRAMLITTNMMAGLQVARVMGKAQFDTIYQAVLDDLRPPTNTLKQITE